MTKEEIKQMLKDSAFWICPDDNELVSINIDRTADKIFKNLPQAVVSRNGIILPSDDEIEKDGENGGLKGGELQTYWEGAIWMRDKIKTKLSGQNNGVSLPTFYQVEQWADKYSQGTINESTAFNAFKAGGNSVLNYIEGNNVGNGG